MERIFAPVEIPCISITKIGDRLFFDVGYSDQCTHLHEYFFGIRDGMKDARAGRSPYSWALITDPTRRPSDLREAKPGGPSAESSCSRW